MEERHLQLRRTLFETLPLLLEGGPVDPASRDQVADRHHELGPQQVELVDGLRVYAVALAPREVAYDGEVELLRVVEEVLAGPRPCALGMLMRELRRACGDGRQGRQRHGHDSSRLVHLLLLSFTSSVDKFHYHPIGGTDSFLWFAGMIS